MDMEIISRFISETFQVIDLLFCGITVCEGDRFSIFSPSEAEIARITRQ